MSYKRDRKLSYFSIFGKLDISRAYYYSFGQEGVFPLDKVLRPPERIYSYLEGKVDYLIGGLEQSLTKRALRGNRKKTLEGVIGYFKPNQGYMRYDQYLAAGYPMGSGLVEGACRNLVKDRFERTGMRWTIEGAEAVLKLRAIYLNGNWNDFWNFHINQEQGRRFNHKGGEFLKRDEPSSDALAFKKAA